MRVIICKCDIYSVFLWGNQIGPDMQKLFLAVAVRVVQLPVFVAAIFLNYE